jgi:hypothetical protein
MKIDVQCLSSKDDVAPNFSPSRSTTSNKQSQSHKTINFIIKFNTVNNLNIIQMSNYDQFD